MSRQPGYEALDVPLALAVQPSTPAPCGSRSTSGGRCDLQRGQLADAARMQPRGRCAPTGATSWRR